VEDSGDGVDIGDDLEDTHGPPHFRQQVMLMAKTRARSFAHAMRRGRGEEAGESLGRAKSSASCGGGGGAGQQPVQSWPPG
jgi:hypothetical protein